MSSVTLRLYFGVELTFGSNNFPPGHFERFIRFLGTALGELSCLTHFQCQCFDEDDFLAASIFLDRLRRISSFQACISISDQSSPHSRIGLVVRAMTGHPSLETLVVHFHSGMAVNPFPTSLSTLPNLRSVSYRASPGEFPKLTNFYPIWGMPTSSLRFLAFVGLSLDGQDNLALADTLANNPGLTSLSVGCCETVYENSPVLCQTLSQHPSLDSLD